MAHQSNPTAKVNGRTKAIGLVAYPSDHVRTPTILNEHMERRGINAVMLPLQVPPLELATVFTGLREIENLAGIIVTVPHKAAAAALCDDLEGVAAALGVCNIIRRSPQGRLVGRMMDGEGFVQGMKQQDIDPRGMNALLLGAGGAATAIAAALIEAQVASLTVVNRTYAKAVELARIVQGLFPTARIQAAESTEGKWDLIVNGTSIGLHDDDPLPIPQEHLNPEAIVAEVIMQPAKTKLLITAEARGCRIHLGEHMVQAQLRGFVDYLSLEN